MQVFFLDKSRLSFAISFFCLLVLCVTSSASIYCASSAVASVRFEDVGYYKAQNRDRIFTVKMPMGATAAQVKAYADSKMNTAGRMTAVYFYAPGSTIPASDVTQARGLFHANSIIYEGKGMSKWKYAYVKNRNGSVTFVDCTKANDSGLCRE